MSTLRYFMWPWQELFRGAAAHVAKRLMRPLDPQLEVDAFLLGFRAQEDAAGTEDICVSPEDSPFRPEVFAGVPDLVEQLAADDPRSSWRCSPPSSPDQYHQMTLSAACPKAVEQTLGALDEKSVFFASEPVLVNGYLVLVIVQADRAGFETHYRLTRDFVQKVQFRYSVGRSLSSLMPVWWGQSECQHVIPAAHNFRSVFWPILGIWRKVFINMASYSLLGPYARSETLGL